MDINKVKELDTQNQMKNARKYGAKDGENNNPYRSLKEAMEAYKQSYN